jgi:type IV pilus assembly protein PilB
VPQDGRFTVKMKNKDINIRASTIPSIHGENMVLRLLDTSTSIYSLELLGMNEGDRQKIEGIITKPYGMILSTGPTGSGKSTSLYSILKRINQPDINIITVEDPVEYRIDKIRQVQLNRKAGMTFASGLRSILRQDPDVIMVGEIRDSETADIAVKSALTGHLVLSTVHANDAPGTVTRLIDMGVPRYLVGSAVTLVMAQRLVRTVCERCKETYVPSPETLAVMGEDAQALQGRPLVRGRGCLACKNTGYHGRTAVFEVLELTRSIRRMVLDGLNEDQIKQKAMSEGLTTLRKHGIKKILEGVTTIEEVRAATLADHL